MSEPFDESKPENPNQDFYEEESSIRYFIGSNIVKIAVGFIIVVTITSGTMFVLLKSSQKQNSQKNETTKAKTTPSTLSDTSTQEEQNQTQTKIYKDATHGFSFQVPITWETFKRTGDDVSYQLALGPTGSADTPITINIQPNPSNLSLDEIVNAYYGASYPKEKKKFSGLDALFVSNFSSSYKSYFFTTKGVIFEISASTVDSQYYPVYDQLISSFNL